MGVQRLPERGTSVSPVFVACTGRMPVPRSGTDAYFDAAALAASALAAACRSFQGNFRGTARGFSLAAPTTM